MINPMLMAGIDFDSDTSWRLEGYLARGGIFGFQDILKSETARDRYINVIKRSGLPRSRRCGLPDGPQMGLHAGF